MITPQMSYSLKKLSTAVRSLAIGRGPIKERLLNAARSSFGVLREENFPPEFLEEWNKISKQLTSEHGPDGAFAASIEAMTEDDVVELADRIVSLHYAIRSYFDEERLNR